MKVVINAQNKDYYNDLYNSIKRSEEDLKYRIPNLKEICVDIAQITSNIASNMYGVVVKHTLVADESQLNISVKYRTEPSSDQILKGISNELKNIKDKYY